MADQRTMAQLIKAPTEGYEDAIVVPAITADNFELKHGLLTLVQNKQFFGHDKEDPHAHTRYFNKITSTLKFPNVLNTSIKLILFPVSLEGAAQIWLKKEPPRSIFTWDDLHFDESFSEAWDRFKDLLRACPHHVYVKANDAVMRNMQTQGQNMQNKLTNLIDLLTKFVNSNNASTSRSGTLPSNTIANPRGYLKAITTRSGVSYDGPQIPPSTSFLPKSLTEINASLTEINASLTLTEINTSLTEINASLTLNNHYLHQQYKLFNREFRLSVFFLQALEQRESSNTSFFELDLAICADSVGLEFYSSFNQSISSSSDTTCCSRDIGSTALLDKVIVTPSNLKELADHSISRPVGVAEDVYVKVGSFHFPADFKVVEFDADPRVPLILRRSFLMTERALIDLFEGELTLRVGKEAITFNLDQTSRYSANYSDMTAKQIDVIDMACEEYSHEVLGFYGVISSGNPTPYYDPIVFTTSLTLTAFENSDFLLEEVDAFLAIKDDPTSPKVDQSYLDPEGDILLLEAFLNDDPSLPLANQGNYMLEVHKELKICEAKSNKSSIYEPPEVELKDLPPHLEYAFLEGNDKLLVIIAKDLSVEEKTALIMVLESHKQAIAWKLSYIKRIDLEFCTHKILMEEDFEPAVQHQRRVNPKIHDVIKKEYDQQYEAFKKSHLQIIAYQVGLESVEARLAVYKQNKSVFEENIKLLNIEVQLRDIALVTLRQKVEKAEQERDDLKLKLEKFQTSSKNLTELLACQTNEKHGLGYFSLESDCEKFPPNLSFAGLDDSVYKCKVTESISNKSKVETNVTKSCTHSIQKPKTHRPSAPIIEEWELDSDNDSTISPISDQPKHTPIKIDFVNPVECVECGENKKQAEKPTGFTQNPKGTGQRGTRPVWDNTARVNHQNKLTRPHSKRNFVPAVILTKSGQVPVNATKQSSHKAVASVSAARRVNIAAPRPNVNNEILAQRLYAKEQAQFKREQGIARKRATEQEATYQEKTTFTCPYRTFAYRRMPFRLYNAPGTFQRCMIAILHDMIEKTIEVFMDDFSVFSNSFQSCLSHLERILKRCEDTNLCLNWEKSHFMVKEGIVLGHKISKQGIKVDKAKVDVITKLPYPITVKAPILIAPDWDMPFELMCDASDFDIGAVLGQHQDKHFRPIHYASKTMTEAESNYTTTKKEMLAVVYAFEKFWSYLIMNKSIVNTDHSALKYLFAKKDSKVRLL
nr:retrovirus-related Pol polyprotein from transposon 17.6 [Tanacetum cinerariifolium]